MENQVYNTIVLGGGVAGLSASIYLGRGAITHLVFTNKKCETASLLSTTSIIENFPGHESIEGKGLIKKIKKQAVKYGAIIIEKCIKKVDFSSKPFKVYTEDGAEYKSSSVIIATGSVPNKLNIENEDKLWGKYISSCVLCDGSRFKNKKICVIGGGDSALENCIMLTKFTNKITLIHRKNTFRASVVMQQRLLKHPKIKVVTGYNVNKLNIDSNDKLVSITCQNENKEEIEIKVHALFYALGFRPNSELFKDILEMDKNGYIVRHPSEYFQTQTSIKEIFACGDVVNSPHKQAIIASASGVASALEVNVLLHQLHIVKDEEF